MSRIKKTNDYTRNMGPLYAAIPKSVWAALAISFAATRTCGPDELETGLEHDRLLPQLFEEWDALHKSGIVPQPSLSSGTFTAIAQRAALKLKEP